jgi:DNA helicase-2/ATP-dependent DNA helicase PcrA
MIWPENLDGVQRDVYLSDAQRVLVLGGPGSGKTQVALLLAQRVIENDPRGRRVLFLTFSRAATSELTKRAPTVLVDSATNTIEVTTFHGFAVGVLDSFRRFTGGPTEPVTIATREETNLGVAAPGAVEFDDIVPSALALFRDAPWVFDLYRERLAAVICDEFQDTRDDQLKLLETLARGRRLVCFADPEQMIYDVLPGAASIARRIETFRQTEPVEFDLGPASYRDPTQVIPAVAAAIRDKRFEASVIRTALENDRLSVRLVDGSVRDQTVDEIRAALAAGAGSIGVFFATNRQVNEFADRLRREGLEHEVAGLSHASGEAEVAAATLARFRIGEATWDEVLLRLGVFLASTWRGQPPLVARQLVEGDAALDAGLARILREQRDRIVDLRDPTIGAFLEECRDFWGRSFRAEAGQRLWDIGINDLVSESLGLRFVRMDHTSVEELGAVAARRRTNAALDALPGVEAPIRVMNLFQIKGRQMDVSLTVREPHDRDPWTPDGIRNLDRLIFVAVSRAKERAGFVLPRGVGGYFAGIGSLTR